MLRLYSVFSSGAMFQAGCANAIRGVTDASDVTLSLTLGDSVVSSGSCTVGSDGNFELSFDSPDASFSLYTVVVRAGDASVTLTDVLFGELWLASGQSNMEFSNSMMGDCEKAVVFRKLRERKIRIYDQSWMGGRGGDSEFPYKPTPELEGAWINGEDVTRLENVSALASEAVCDIYDFLNKDSNIPVGFLNVSVGGSSIGTWISREAADTDGVREYMLNLRDENTWNKYGGGNFNQCSALFNLKVFPLIGMKMRGVLWYQGENEVGGRDKENFYINALRVYRSSYERLFGCGDFYMVCSQIFPYLYGADMSRMAYINSAIAKAAASDASLACAPIYDFKAIWAAGKINHPIHPANKYDVGVRVATLACRAAYGARGVRTAPVVKEYFCGDDGLDILFNTFGGVLRGGVTRDLYVAGDDGVYYETTASITGRNRLHINAVDGVDVTKVAYKFGELDNGAELWCGDIPVSCFASDTENVIKVENRAWMHTEIDSMLVQAPFTEKEYGYYYRPTWLPLTGCSVCRDSAFTSGKASLRIHGENEEIGACVRAYGAYALDFFRYSGLMFTYIGCKEYSVKVFLTFDGRQVELKAEKTDIDADRAFYKCSFDGIPQKNAEMLTVSIHTKETPPFIKTAAVEGFYLV